jgi:hypothetical protein
MGKILSYIFDTKPAIRKIPNISVITEIEVLCWKHNKEEEVEQYSL